MAIYRAAPPAPVGEGMAAQGSLPSWPGGRRPVDSPWTANRLDRRPPNRSLQGGQAGVAIIGGCSASARWGIHPGHLTANRAREHANSWAPSDQSYAQNGSLPVSSLDQGHAAPLPLRQGSWQSSGWQMAA